MPQINLHNIATEQRNPRTSHIDCTETLEMLRLINNEDKLVAPAIEKILPKITDAVDLIVRQLQSGGRLFYIGAGTSGRLGVLDAVECPPTYGVSPELVQGIIAGGTSAIFKAKEGAEDSRELGAADIQSKGLTACDVVVGLAASGRTPYVLGAIEYAASIGVPTIGITCSHSAPLLSAVNIGLLAEVGPEVITGSTRLKAGTAQKLLLNMLSTGAMIRLGKVYGNLMVDVKTTNAKLVERARQIVIAATGESYETSCEYLAKANGNAKLAIFMILSGLDSAAAAAVLNENNGYIAKALTCLTAASREDNHD